MRKYVYDAALARKDVLPEPRRDTLPAMVLRPGRRLPLPSASPSRYRLLWLVILHGAACPAGVPQNEQDDGWPLLALCDRAVWSGVGRRACVPRVGRVVAARARAVLSDRLVDGGGGGAADLGIVAVGTMLSAMASVTRSRELLMPLLFLPLAIPIVVGGVGASISDDPARYLGFLALYDAVFAIISWASFEYVVSE
jgi:hypothetical protein